MDRLLGGPGQMPPENRDLTDIEVALSDQSAMLILAEWCNHWPEMRDLHATILGHENNSKFLQTSPPDTSMLVLTVAARLPNRRRVSDGVSVCHPGTADAPAQSAVGRHRERAPTPRPSQPRWNAGFDEVKVPLTVKWQGLKMSAGESPGSRPATCWA